MSSLTCFEVDAFTRRTLGGNPAAVCVLPSWPEDAPMQALARQLGLSETAFAVPVAPGRHQLRWFTPAVEVDLCGHATLATAHVLYQELGYAGGELVFDTRSGPLRTRRDASGRIALDLPARAPQPANPPAGLLPALGGPEPVWIGRARDWMVVLPDAEAVLRVNPDFAAVTSAAGDAPVIVTAPGEDCDFVSRFFAPAYGVPEDPVTGSAHCTLVPYWSARLGRTELHARQLSSRGGELWCSDRGDRVSLAGEAVTRRRDIVSL